MILKLKDGGIKKIKTDTECERYCDTCDYGTLYIFEIYIEMEKHRIKIETNREHEYSISESDLFKIIISNIEKIQEMTEKAFYLWLIDEIKKITPCCKVRADIKEN